MIENSTKDTRSTRLIAPEPGRLELEHYSAQAPGPGQVAGPTIASLISPGTELAMAFGSDSHSRYSFPLEIGYAAVFRVEQVGREVSDIQIGDVVFSMGTHCSYQCVDAQKVATLPSGLDPFVAVFARMMNVPMAALVTTKVSPGQDVGVNGLGLIGQMTARTFAASGFSVLAADSSSERRSFLPPGVPSAPTLEAAELDLIVECSGKEDGMLASARGLRKGGELVLTGVPWERRSDAYLYDLVDLIFHRYLVVRSGWEWQVPWETGPRIAARASISQNLRHALSWLDNGAVQVDGLAEIVTPETAIAAYQSLRDRQAPRLTYIIRWA